MTPPTPEALAALDALIAKSVATATPSVADSVAYPERQMSAAELYDFLQRTRLVAMATVGQEGQPHIAPVHIELDGTTVRLVVYEDTVRRRDLARNPRVAFTTWHEGGVAIFYGRASEIPDSLRDSRPGRSGKPRRVIGLSVALSRVYAMRPPSA